MKSRELEIWKLSIGYDFTPPTWNYKFYKSDSLVGGYIGPFFLWYWRKL